MSTTFVERVVYQREIAARGPVVPPDVLREVWTSLARSEDSVAW